MIPLFANDQTNDYIELIENELKRAGISYSSVKEVPNRDNEFLVLINYGQVELDDLCSLNINKADMVLYAEKHDLKLIVTF